MRAVRSERQMNNKSMPLRAAVVLLIFTMFSTWMLSGMLAKYVAKDAASDSARVAFFDVSTDVEEGVTGQILDIGDKDSSVYYKFTLKNDSEVAVSCDIKVVLDEKDKENTIPVPAGIDMVLNDPDGGETTISTVSGQTEYVFVSGIKMKPKEQKDGILTFKPGSVDYITFAQFADGLAYSKEYEFKVGVTFVQID